MAVGMVMKAIILISMVVCITPVAYAISGQAIVYNPPYFPYFGSREQGHVMIAKAHNSLFANGGACGRRYRVRCISGINKAIRNACTGNTVDVMVVDRCERCAVNDLELSQEAFCKDCPSCSRESEYSIPSDLMIHQGMKIHINEGYTCHGM